MSRRTERVASMVQRELSEIIMRQLSDPRLTGLPSITRVKISEDLSNADIFVTIMGEAGQQTAGLNALRHAAGMMRTKLAKIMSMRTVPYLKFHIDEDLKKELAVLDLLEKARRESEELERRRAGQSAPQDGQNQREGDQPQHGE